MKTAIRCLALCGLLNIPQAVYAQENDAEILYATISERLGLMKDVAAWKWARNLPVEDIEREKLVIEKAVNTGLEQGITVTSSRRFFAAQIAAAKAVQHCWIKRWQKTPPDFQPRDLTQVVRPQLIDLGDRISKLLPTNNHDKSLFTATVTIDCLPAESLSALFSALQEVRFYATRLDQILDSGTLRVGTTGDYAPFSFAAASGDPTGIDIDLAEDLATSLGVEFRLIHTSWPTLMQDLSHGRYDIAMSGVSRTVARARQGYFSSAYHVGGKTPITRCSQVPAFNTLAKIDQPGVRVIVNPGGTNEKFLDANLRNVIKVMHEDNRTIFDEIIADHADLMLTDAIEVALQTRIHPQLCAAMPGETLTYQEKGYLMPRDDALRSAVNLWLDQRRGDGTLARVFNSHLAP